MQFMRVGGEVGGRDARPEGEHGVKRPPADESEGELQDAATQSRLRWQDTTGAHHDFQDCEALEVLGCLISISVLEAVRHRLARAEVAFWSNRSFFCSTVISWERKVREYIRRTRSIALYGAVMWTWSTSVFVLLCAWEGRLLRYMLRLSWDRDAESFGEWRQRHNRHVRKVMLEYGAEELHEAALRRQFRWTTAAFH